MSRDKQEKPPAASGPPPAPQWMLTYADAMSLLLTFFVMLLTFSTMNREEFEKASGGLRGALGDLLASSLDGRPSIIADRISYSGRVSTYGVETPPEIGPTPWRGMPLDVRIKRRLAGTPVTLATSRKGFVLRLPADDLFNGVTPELTEQGRRIIGEVAAVIRHLRNDIEVAAHTDGTAPGGAGSEEDIALSAAQSIAVAQALEAVEGSIEEGSGIDSHRLGVSVPGGTVPRFSGAGPVALANHRRVEITLVQYGR